MNEILQKLTPGQLKTVKAIDLDSCKLSAKEFESLLNASPGLEILRLFSFEKIAGENIHLNQLPYLKTLFIDEDSILTAEDYKNTFYCITSPQED